MEHTPTNRLTRAELSIILLLAAVNFTHTLDFVLMMPLGPQFMRIFAIDAAQFARLVSSYTFSAAASGILAAFLIDRFDRKRAMLFIYFGFIVGTALCAGAWSYRTLLFARIAAGAFGGIAGSLIFSILGDVIPDMRRGRATGIVMSAFSVASVVGIPVGLWFANVFDWHAPFIAVAVLSGFVWILALIKLPSIRGHLDPKVRSKALDQVKSILTDRNAWSAFNLTIVLNMSSFMVIPLIAPAMVSNVGLLESQLPWIYLCGGVFTFFSSQFVGRLTDRLGKVYVFDRALLLSLIPILVLTHMPVWPLPLILCFTSLYMILMNARFVPAISLITAATPPERRGAFMSLNSVIQQTAVGVAALCTGLIVETLPSGRIEHFGTVGWISSVFSLSAIWIARNVRARF